MTLQPMFDFAAHLFATHGRRGEGGARLLFALLALGAFWGFDAANRVFSAADMRDYLTFESGISALEPVEVTAVLDHPVTPREITAYRVSPRGNFSRLHPSVVETEFVRWEIPESYVGGVALGVSPGADGALNSFQLKIGDRYETFGPHEVSPIDPPRSLAGRYNAGTLFSLTGSRHEPPGSLFPPFREVLNYRGDAALLVPGLLIAAAAAVLFLVLRIGFASSFPQNTAVLSFVLLGVGMLGWSWAAPGSVGGQESAFYWIAGSTGALLLLLSLAVKWPRRVTEPLEGAPEALSLATTRVLLAALIGGGAVVRLIWLGQMSFQGDEMYQGVALQQVLQHGIPRMPDGTIYMRGFPQVYLSALLVRGAGLDVGEVAVRLPSALAGIALVPVGYVVGKRSGGRLSGLLAAAIIAFLPWTVDMSRWARMYSLTTLLAGCALLFGLRSIQEQTFRPLLFSLAAAVAAIVVDLSGVVALVPAGTAVVWFVYERYGRGRPLRFAAMILVAGIALLAVLVAGLTLLNFAGGRAPGLTSALRRVWAYLGGSEFDMFYILFALRFFFITALLSAVLFKVSASRSQRLKETFLIATSLLAVLFVVLYNAGNESRYVYFVVVALVPLTAYALARSTTAFARGSNRKAVQALLLLAAGFLLLSWADPQGSAQIAARAHGNRYAHPLLTPNLGFNYVADTRSNARAATRYAGPADLVFTLQPEEQYFYSGARMPDADLKLKGPAAVRSELSEAPEHRYFSSVPKVTTSDQAFSLLERLNGTRKAVFSIGARRRNDPYYERARALLRDLSADGYTVKLVHVGDEPLSRVYTVSKGVQ